MERKARTARSDLEQLLVDQNAEPKALPLSLLEDITGDFSYDQVIGSGGFALVYKGILGDRAVAVKKLSDAFMDETKFHREIECLMRVKHKNVVRFLGYCAVREGNMEKYDGKLVMADVHQRLLCFEYIPKGSLDKYIIDPHHEWGMRYKIIKGICEGLQSLHDKRIVHLDLKPANILLDDNMIPKITDFGLSRCFDRNQSHDITKNILGTIGYWAPELLAGGEIARSNDLYSLGVIILEILTGHKGCQDIGDVLQSWSDRLEISQRDTLCEQIHVCYDIALECTEFNPKKRPASARDILDRLHEMESIQLNRTVDEVNSGDGEKMQKDEAAAARDVHKDKGKGIEVAGPVHGARARAGRGAPYGERAPRVSMAPAPAPVGAPYGERAPRVSMAPAPAPVGAPYSERAPRVSMAPRAPVGAPYGEHAPRVSMAPAPAPVGASRHHVCPHGRPAYPQPQGPPPCYYNHYGGIGNAQVEWYANAGSDVPPRPCHVVFIAEEEDPNPCSVM